MKSPDVGTGGAAGARGQGKSQFHKVTFYLRLQPDHFLMILNNLPVSVWVPSGSHRHILKKILEKTLTLIHQSVFTRSDRNEKNMFQELKSIKTYFWSILKAKQESNQDLF